jgi:hypothetical protein
LEHGILQQLTTGHFCRDALISSISINLLNKLIFQLWILPEDCTPPLNKIGDEASFLASFFGIGSSMFTLWLTLFVFSSEHVLDKLHSFGFRTHLSILKVFCQRRGVNDYQLLEFVIDGITCKNFFGKVNNLI